MVCSNNPENGTYGWTFALSIPAHHSGGGPERGKNVPRFDSSSLSNHTPDRHKPRSNEPFAWLLWSAVVVTFLADLALTALGLSRGFSERNLIAAEILMSFGFAGLVVVKTLVLLFAVVVWWILPEPYRVAAPASLAAPWGLATLVNAAVLLL